VRSRSQSIGTRNVSGATTQLTELRDKNSWLWIDTRYSHPKVYSTQHKTNNTLLTYLLTQHGFSVDSSSEV